MVSVRVQIFRTMTMTTMHNNLFFQFKNLCFLYSNSAYCFHIFSCFGLTKAVLYTSLHFVGSCKSIFVFLTGLTSPKSNCGHTVLDQHSARVALTAATRAESPTAAPTNGAESTAAPTNGTASPSDGKKNTCHW